MADIHQLIRRHGIEEARRQALTSHERAVVEAAYRVLAEENEGIGFTYWPVRLSGTVYCHKS